MYPAAMWVYEVNGSISSTQAGIELLIFFFIPTDFLGEIR